MPPVINKELCVGCGVCADICPTNVLRHAPKEDKVPEIRFPDECWHCNSCVLDCPQGAITLRIPLPQILLRVDASKLNLKK